MRLGTRPPADSYPTVWLAVQGMGALRRFVEDPMDEVNEIRVAGASTADVATVPEPLARVGEP
eukprot:4191678-Pyramimonas_sp.AAC.1